MPSTASRDSTTSDAPYAPLQVHYAEYGVIWVTFLLINLVGLELGMASGVLIAMFTFILDYAKQPVVARVTLRSNVMRSPALSAEPSWSAAEVRSAAIASSAAPLTVGAMPSPSAAISS